jgi:hypothetical protein
MMAAAAFAGSPSWVPGIASARERGQAQDRRQGTSRLYAGRHPDDPRLNELVGELTIRSADFRRWWNARTVHERTHGTKRMTHPAVGALTIRYEALVLPGDEEQTLFIYTADPGSASADNLRLLSLWSPS